jgi:hypothetical protein
MGWRIASVLPFALGACSTLLLRPVVASFLAPLAGPWAGLLYGHSDCTMANTLPVPSFTAVGLGITIGCGLVFAGAESRWRHAWRAGLVAWGLLWNVLAALSVVNTLS